MPRRKTQPMITYGYNHLDVGHPDNPVNYRICGAQTRNPEAKYPVCTQPAGLRTEHSGVGRCYLHAGKALAGPDNPAWKGGRYAHIYKGRLKQHFEALQADAADPLDLLPELEVQRVLLAAAIEELQGDNGFANSNYQKHTNRIQNDLPAQISGGPDAPGLGEVGDGLDVGDGDERSGVFQGGDAATTIRATPSTPTITSALGYPHHTPPSGNFLISSEKLALVTELANNVVKTVTQIIVARNQTALTLTEIKYLKIKMVEGIERFIPDPTQRAAFIEWLIAELPGGDDASGAQES